MLALTGENAKSFCERTGLSYGTFRRVTGDRDSGMSTGTILKISNAFGVDPSELLTER
jgi:hypothetical protein